MGKRSRGELETMKMVAGVLLAIVTALEAAVRELGGTFEHIRRLTTPEGAETVRAIATLIVSGGKTATKTLGDTYRVTVDYGKTLAEMIAVGGYNYVNPNINEKNFPLEHSEPMARIGNGPYHTPKPTAGNIVELVLVHLNRVIGTVDVLQYLDEHNLRPATLAELLALGASNPGLQQEFPIVALGSLWLYSFGNRAVPCLWDDRGGRKLSLFWYGRGWDGYYRFLAVSK